MKGLVKVDKYICYSIHFAENRNWMSAS